MVELRHLSTISLTGSQRAHGFAIGPLVPPRNEPLPDLGGPAVVDSRSHKSPRVESDMGRLHTRHLSHG